MGDGVGTVFGKAERAAARVAGATAANLVGELVRAAIEFDEAELGVPLVVIEEIDSAAILGPMWVADIAVEFVGDTVRVRAIALHQVQACDLVALKFVVEAGVGDALSVGRNSRRAVWAAAIRKRTHAAISDVELVDLGIARSVFVVVVTVGAH